jgi:hypothetical protein
MSKYHFAETGLQTLQTFASDGISIKASDDVCILESKCAVELKRKGNALQIMGKEGETLFGGDEGFAAGQFRGAMNFNTINGRTTINGIPAEEYQQRQALAQKRAREPEQEGSRFNRVWTFPLANAFRKITNSGSGDLSLNASLLAPRCDISTESSGSILLMTDEAGENKCVFETLAVHINSSGEVRVIPELHVQTDLVVRISSSGNFDAANLVYANAVRLNVDGSGNSIFTQLIATSCVTSINGSGDVKIRGGNLESLQVLLNGSGDAEMNIHTQTAKVSSNGSGDIAVGQVVLNADVKSRGSGDISLEVDQDCAVEKVRFGSGSIRIKRVATKQMERANKIASTLHTAAAKAEVRGAENTAKVELRAANPPGGPSVYEDLPPPPPYSEI